MRVASTSSAKYDPSQWGRKLRDRHIHRLASRFGRKQRLLRGIRAEEGLTPLREGSIGRRRMHHAPLRRLFANVEYFQKRASKHDPEVGGNLISFGFFPRSCVSRSLDVVHSHALGRHGRPGPQRRSSLADSRLSSAYTGVPTTFRIC